MKDDLYDVAVIGGGPAGMMAAGRAAELGARVVLLEKNATLGQKLLITGGGRCNILNAEFDAHLLTEKYGKKGKCLFSGFAQFDVQATVDFFAERGLPIKVEAEKRAFPVTEKAEDVHKTMVRYMAKHGVEVRTECPVSGVEKSGKLITKVVHNSGFIKAKNYVLATGGKSRPETGSTGDAFPWLTELGHTVTQPDPALVPVTLKDRWVPELSGVSFKGVKLSVSQQGKTHDARAGKLLFTHFGLSGPLVLNMSKGIGALLKHGPVSLALDLFPALDEGAVDRMVLASFTEGQNKLIKNHCGQLVPPKLGHVLLRLANIDGETPLYRLTREERQRFAGLLKALPMEVSGLLGEDKAVVTGGGVSLKEVEFSTMQSKLFPNLFLVGDILDFDRPSGGFSLQICWTTGWVAGTHAAGNQRLV